MRTKWNRFPTTLPWTHPYTIVQLEKRKPWVPPAFSRPWLRALNHSQRYMSLLRPQTRVILEWMSLSLVAASAPNVTSTPFRLNPRHFLFELECFNQVSSMLERARENSVVHWRGCVCIEQYRRRMLAGCKGVFARLFFQVSAISR